MSIDDTTVAFLGQKKVTPEEVASLAVLGNLLRQAGGELHTSQIEGACLAVLRGYKSAGGRPVLHTKGLHETSPWFILYGDDEFLDAILVRWPNPGDTRGWTYIKSLDQLDRYNQILTEAIATLKEAQANP